MATLAKSNRNLGVSLWPTKMSVWRLNEIARRLSDWLLIDLDPKALNDEAVRELLPEWRGTISELVQDAMRRRVEAYLLVGGGALAGWILRAYLVSGR